MAVLALVDDLMFASKIQATAVQLGVPLEMARSVPGESKPWALVLVDLELSSADPIEAIRTLRQRLPETPILGFGSHVRTDLLSRARNAGSSEVLPRSMFVQRLPDLLRQGADHGPGIGSV